MYETERDVFISNGADSLVCNTADLWRQEGEQVRVDILPRKTSFELMEYALGREILSIRFCFFHSLMLVHMYI